MCIEYLPGIPDEIPEIDLLNGITFFFQLVYSLNTGRDYGTILCWAENELGSQSDPCVFHLIPAGKKNDYTDKVDIFPFVAKKKPDNPPDVQPPV